MTNKPFKAVSFLTTLLLLAGLLGCAAPRQGVEFDRASLAIRAAENAGAAQYAPAAHARAQEIYSKAVAMNSKRRSNRAQKLLELATAEARLAKATSEAEQAEASLQYTSASLPR